MRGIGKWVVRTLKLSWRNIDTYRKGTTWNTGYRIDVLIPVFSMNISAFISYFSLLSVHISVCFQFIFQSAFSPYFSRLSVYILVCFHSIFQTAFIPYSSLISVRISVSFQSTFQSTFSPYFSLLSVHILIHISVCFQSKFQCAFSPYAFSSYFSLLSVHISICFNPIFQSGSVSTSVQVLFVFQWSICDKNFWCVFLVHVSDSCVFVCVFQAKKSYQNRCQEKDQVDTQVAQVKTGSVNAQPKDLEKLYNKQSRIRQDQERAGMWCLYT